MSVKVAGVVPEAGDTLSQLAFEMETLKPVAEAAFNTICWTLKAVSPKLELKVTARGLGMMVLLLPVSTVRATIMVTGVAPLVMVMVSL